MFFWECHGGTYKALRSCAMGVEAHSEERGLGGLTALSWKGKVRVLDSYKDEGKQGRLTKQEMSASCTQRAPVYTWTEYTRFSCEGQ